jgi:hypothetical protein
LAGFLFYTLSRTVYIASFEADTGGVDNSVVINHINKLDMAIKKPDILAKYLGLTAEQVKNIKSIKASYGIDVNGDGKQDYIDMDELYNPKDTMEHRVPSFVHVSVSLYDESILPDVRRGLFRYINDNALLQELFRIDKMQKEQFVEELKSEIAKMDTLRRVQMRKEMQADKGQTMIIIGNINEQKQASADMLLLHEKIRELQKSLSLNREIIIVVQDFTELLQEEKTVLNVMLNFAAAMASFGLFFAMFWQYRMTIWGLISCPSGQYNFLQKNNELH